MWISVNLDALLELEKRLFWIVMWYNIYWLIDTRESCGKLIIIMKKWVWDEHCSGLRKLGWHMEVFYWIEALFCKWVFSLYPLSVKQYLPFLFFIKLDYCASLKNLEIISTKQNYKFIQVREIFLQFNCYSNTWLVGEKNIDTEWNYGQWLWVNKFYSEWKNEALGEAFLSRMLQPKYIYWIFH